jgi:hypothetical protein
LPEKITEEKGIEVEAQVNKKMLFIVSMNLYKINSKWATVIFTKTYNFENTIA